jgi:hypothetical protein
VFLIVANALYNSPLGSSKASNWLFSVYMIFFSVKDFFTGESGKPDEGNSFFDND